MKKLSLVLIAALISGSGSAQVLEPSEGMKHTITIVADCDSVLLQQKLLGKIGGLRGVEIDPHSHLPMFDVEPWHPAFNKGTWMAASVSELNLVSVKVWWMPPKPAPQNIANGGSDVRPLRSIIWILIGSLKTNHNATVVMLIREWTYNERMHLPWTPIPLWRGNSSEQGTYPGDRDWVRDLVGSKKSRVFIDKVAYDPGVMTALKAVPLPEGQSKRAFD